MGCCEGDGIAEPCVPGQCPLMAAEPMAPFGGLPTDPFLAKIVDGKCVCPEPQQCSAALEYFTERTLVYSMRALIMHWTSCPRSGCSLVTDAVSGHGQLLLSPLD